MFLAGRFMAMMFAQQAGYQQLLRKPEPNQVTDATANVLQYDCVLATKLAIAYAVGIEILHRARASLADRSAVDLACGPGHYTLCLAYHLSYETIEGIDLSAPMVETARANAARQGLQDRVHFRTGDVTAVPDLASSSIDLASFTDAAHHMPDLVTVEHVLHEMDRITKPDGLIMVMDLVRLRTAKLTEHYVNTLGHDYVQRGLPQFFDDFRNSMYAAWTAEELHQAIPRNSRRWWCHLVPRGLPTIQIILGLPVGRKKVFVRSGLPWPKDKNPVPKEMHSEWRMLRWSLAFGSRRMVPPVNPIPSSP